jgi:hypothetical protein
VDSITSEVLTRPTMILKWAIDAAKAGKFWLDGHHETLGWIFEEPPPDISWPRIEGLLLALRVEPKGADHDGVNLYRGRGPIIIRGKLAKIYPPKDGDTANINAVRAIRSCLEEIGIKKPDWESVKRAITTS